MRKWVKIVLIELGHQGTNAVAAAPVLTERLKETNELRGLVVQALLAIDPIAAAKAGVSTNAPGK